MRNGDEEAGRILVVDDDEEIRRLSKLVLESAGYQCAVAHNTKQAQARLAEDDFDLMISDLRMPGESGLRLMENARAAEVDVPTIIVTALDDRKAAAAAIERGAYGYITKPFRMNELLIGVENALRRRSLEIESRRQRHALEEQLSELEEGARELRRSEAHFRAVAESAVDGIVSTDSDGNVIHFNPSAQLMFGYRPDEIVGKPFASLIAERFRSAYEDAVRQFFATAESDLIGTRREVEGKRRNDESFPMELSLSTWTVDGDTFFTAVLRDISERRALVQLEQSNSDLERFAYVASHDLSEPLRTVTSYVQLLASRYQGRLDSDADDFIGFAVDATKRMQALIDNLLEYSRAGSAEYEMGTVDCSEIAREALVLLESKIEETGAAVEIGELPAIWCDARQMSQVFQNLIRNALTYRSDKPSVRVGAERSEHGWCFWVSDNGIGIASEDAERIFEMLERLHTQQEYGGSGLGLAICKRIVERHGGRIWAEPNPESGATFRFTIADPDGGRLDGQHRP